jgi:flagellar biosynthesis protein FliR
MKKQPQLNTMMIGLLGTILLGVSSWALMTIVQLEVHIGMLSEEIMSIDKQIGRIYNHMDRMMNK